jgi:hypothetical protein
MARPSALFALALGGAAAFEWFHTACPLADKPMPSACAQPALATDAAITLFFQVETRSGGANFSCADASDPSITYCARAWTQPESGAAGSCFFLLPAGHSYKCSGAGNVDVIDASYAPLRSALAPAAQKLACPSASLAAGASCEQPALAADAYVYLSFAGAAAAGGAFTCSAAGATVCAFSTALTGVSDASSCAFLLAANTPLSCSATLGAIAFGAPRAVPLTIAYAGNNSKRGIAPCPRSGPKPNDCDCVADITKNTTDAFVSISATTPDAGCACARSRPRRGAPNSISSSLPRPPLSPPQSIPSTATRRASTCADGAATSA